jgi:TRAP-type C4-dicarboxylate transport system substrate-binding protein
MNWFNQSNSALIRRVSRTREPGKRKIIERGIHETKYSGARMTILLTPSSCCLFRGGKADTTEGRRGEKNHQALPTAISRTPKHSEITWRPRSCQKYVQENSKTWEVKIYAANALGEKRAVTKGIQLAAALAASSAHRDPQQLNRRSGSRPPLLMKDYDHVHRSWDERSREMIAKDLEGAGFKVLAWMDTGDTGT